RAPRGRKGDAGRARRRALPPPRGSAAGGAHPVRAMRRPFLLAFASVALACGAKPPSAPGSLKVVGATPSKVDLTWDAVNAPVLSGYIVERAVVGDDLYAALGGTVSGT